MEGEDPYPCACDSAWGGLLEFGPQLSSGAKIRTSLHLHCLYFPFPAAWSTFLLNSLVSFFSVVRVILWIFSFFFLGLWVFAFLGLCVFGRMTYAVTSMLSPSTEKPGTRVLAFRVAAHHVCISGFGCRGKLRFLTGVPPFPPPLLNHVHSTLQRAKHVVRSRPMLSAYTFVFYIIFYTIFYFVFYILYYIYICNLHLHFISVYCIRILHPYFTFSFMF